MRGRRYAVHGMELLKPSLWMRLKRIDLPLGSLEAAASSFRSQALRTAQEARAVHRDLKPGNNLPRPEGGEEVS